MKYKCHICFKKLSKIHISIYTCKCLKMYCAIHMHNHDCNYDYKTNFQSELKNKLVSFGDSKVIKF